MNAATAADSLLRSSIAFREILGLLDVATDVKELDLPHFRLHALVGDRKGQWAVTVRANWRIVFRFDDEAEDVDLIDYH